MSRLVSVALLSATLCSASSVLATDWYVLPDGNGDHPTIQAALNAAEDGDVVILADGVFEGFGNYDIDLLGKRVSVRSESGNRDACVIDCTVAEPVVRRGFLCQSGEGPDSVIEGLTVIGARAPSEPASWGAGFLAIDSSPTVRNCAFIDCEAGWGPGLLFWNSSSTVTDVIVRGCKGTANGGAIYCTTEADVHLDRVLVYGNESLGHGGGLVSNACLTRVTNSTFADNLGASVLWAINGGEIEATNTIIAGHENSSAAVCSQGGAVFPNCSNVYGNAVNWGGCLSGWGTVDGNFSDSPDFCDASAGDYTLDSDSPCAPGNSECGLVGALPVGCGDITGAPGGMALDAALPSCSPNPFSDYVEFRIPPLGQDAARLRVFDSGGREVMSRTIENARTGEVTVGWDVGGGTEGVPAGVYRWIIETESATHRGHVVRLR